jgi:hypothetical protein
MRKSKFLVLALVLILALMSAHGCRTGSDPAGGADSDTGSPGETPTAHDIEATLELDVKLPIRLQGTDPERGPVTYNVETQPQNGSLLGSAPELFYVLDDVQFTGDDSFTYTVSDGVNTSAPATVDILVRDNEIVSSDLVGALDDLVAHVPNHLLYRDLGSSNLTITVDSDDNPLEHLLRRTDFTNKSMTLDLGSNDLSPPYSISLKWIPESSNATATILDASGLSLKQDSGTVVTTVGSTDAAHPTTPYTESCNHVVISVTGSGVTTYVNGTSAQTSATPSVNLTGEIIIGPFPGRIWDLRVYDDATSASNANLGAEDCTDVLEEPNFPEDADPLPSYKCGVYICLWYNEADDITEEQVLSFLWHQDGFYEYNALVVGLHPHGEIGASFRDGRPGWTGLAKWRDIPLGKRWIQYAQVAAPYDDAYWVHEDFHQYQGGWGSAQSSRELAESTAEWAPLEYDPDNLGLWITGEYTYDPHLPFWAIYDQTGYSTWRGEGGPADSPENNGGYIYGNSVFQTFVTNEVLSPKYIGDVFNHQGSRQTTEAIYKILADHGMDMAEMFRDFSARVITFDYSYGEVLMANEIASFNGMQSTNPSLTIDSKFVDVFGPEGTGPDLQSPPSGKRPGSWAYNSYKVVGAMGEYSVSVVPGDNPDYADFRATVILYDPETETRTYFPIDDPLEVGITINASGEELYLVVATTPQKFEGTEQYDYKYRISPI